NKRRLQGGFGAIVVALVQQHHSPGVLTPGEIRVVARVFSDCFVSIGFFLRRGGTTRQSREDQDERDEQQSVAWAARPCFSTEKTRASRPCHENQSIAQLHEYSIPFHHSAGASGRRLLLALGRINSVSQSRFDGPAIPGFFAARG